MNTTGRLVDAKMVNNKPVISLELDSDAGLTELLEKDLLRIEVKKYRAKRSLNANAYMWVLVGEIAEKIGEPRTAVYHKAIEEAGVMKPFVVRSEIADEVQEMLTDVKPQGTGNFALVGASRKGWTEVYFYEGSSNYDTEQMSRLIDYIVGEAKDLGIDTMTPEEIERLKAEWESQ